MSSTVPNTAPWEHWLLQAETLLIKSCGLAGLPTLSTEIAAILQQKNPFVLAMFGEVGAGKTTFMRYLLPHLGIPVEEGAASPSYGLIRELDMPSGEKLLHMDCYFVERFPQVIKEVAFMDFRGLMIEWPEKAWPEISPLLTHALKIEVKEGEFHQRTLSFYRSFL